MNSNKKVVLVTGSAKGIGKSLIEKFASMGYDVVINYNTSEKEAYELSKRIEKEYDIKSLVIKCDITNEKEVLNMKKIIEKEFNSIDILINNAAYASDNYIKDKTKEEFMRVLEVNVCGTFLVTKYLSDIVKDVIVNVSSTDAINTYNRISMDYSASKAGVNSLTKTFSDEFKNLRVIGVMPRWTNTDSIKDANPEYIKEELKRTKQERLYEPEEVANNIIKVINNKNIKSGDIVEV